MAAGRPLCVVARGSAQHPAAGRVGIPGGGRGREQPPSRRARAAAVLRDGPDTFAGPCSTRSSTVRVVMPRAAAIRWLDNPVTQEFREALVSRLTRASPRGVSDGARTRDTQDHNLVLYQLSYTHHVSPARRERLRGTEPNDTGDAQASDAAGGALSAVSPSGAAASPAASRPAKESTTSSAALRASSPLGPGVGTNSVLR
jgi:hypothetical protein